MDHLADALRKTGLSMTVHPVNGEPDTANVDAAVEAARESGADVVVGLGGGSALDTAKADRGVIIEGPTVNAYGAEVIVVRLTSGAVESAMSYLWEPA